MAFFMAVQQLTRSASLGFSFIVCCLFILLWAGATAADTNPEVEGVDMNSAQKRWHLGAVLTWKKKNEMKHKQKDRKICVRWIKPVCSAMINLQQIKYLIHPKAELPER